MTSCMAGQLQGVQPLATGLAPSRRACKPASEEQKTRYHPRYQEKDRYKAPDDSPAAGWTAAAHFSHFRGITTVHFSQNQILYDVPDRV